MHLPVCVYWVCQYWPHPSARHDLSDTLRANTLILLRKKLTNKNYFYCSGLDVKTIAVGSQQSPTSTHQHHCYKAPILRCTWTRKRESTRGNSTAARRGKKGRESEKRAQRSWRSCCGRRADVTGAPKTEAARSTTRTEGPDLICGTFWRFEQPDTRSVNDGGFFPAVKKKKSARVFLVRRSALPLQKGQSVAEGCAQTEGTVEEVSLPFLLSFSSVLFSSRCQ